MQNISSHLFLSGSRIDRVRFWPSQFAAMVFIHVYIRVEFSSPETFENLNSTGTLCRYRYPARTFLDRSWSCNRRVPRRKCQMLNINRTILKIWSECWNVFPVKYFVGDVICSGIPISINAEQECNPLTQVSIQCSQWTHNAEW